MGKIVIEVPWDIDRREAVDAIASLALKSPHKRYGEWMKRLAEVVKEVVNPAKGDWQRWWTVATKAFELLYRGWSVEAAYNAVSQLARQMRISDVNKVRSLVEAINNRMEYILGVHAREEKSGQAQAGRR